MVLPNWLFDLVVFGTLLIAALLDASVRPLADSASMLAGAATLIAVGAAAYLVAQEISDALARGDLWTQEAAATATTLSLLGFIYFQRNDSDLALLALSIVLMMASLMLAIALIACVGAVIREGSIRPLLGLLATVISAALLGALAGFFTLSNNLALKITLLLTGFAIWKLREKVRPPGRSTALKAMEKAAARSQQKATLMAGERTLSGAPRPAPEPVAEAAPRALIAQQGTLLDRIGPVLVLGALLLIITQRDSLKPSQPAAASSNADEPVTLPLAP